MALRIKIILNPTSGRQSILDTVKEIITQLTEENALLRADLCITQKYGDARDFAANTDEAAYDLLLAVGGDGTINEVVNGLLQQGIDLPLAVLPAGTANDFANYFGCRFDPQSFVRMLIELQVRRIDVGKAGEHYFANVAAGGYLTEIAHKVPSDVKTALGRLAYWLEGAKDIPARIFDTISLDIDADGGQYHDDALLFVVANTSSVAGIKKLAPKARVDDGLLDVLILSKLEFSDILPLAGKLFVGDHLSDEHIHFFQTRELHVSCRAPHGDLDLDIDGEKADRLPVQITCIPKALQVVVPTTSFDKTSSA